MRSDSELLPPFPFRSFFSTCFLANVWIGISQTLRYFIVVVPIMRAAYPENNEIVPINVPVILAWGIWVTIYLFWATSSIWIYFERFGTTIRNAVIAGSLATIPAYGLFWLALYLMNLATAKVILIALPMAWFELIVVALIVRSRINR